MDKLKMHTADLTDKNIERIAELFPNVITETRDANGTLKKAVDFDLLKQALSKELVEADDERYRLDWPGKKASLLKANTPITQTLRPCREESVNFDTTENLYIEGDNFEVLKILQESYLGKVKMIYIDPPYNTGNDFIYKDDFKKTKDEYEEELGVEDDEGGKLFRNTDSNGRFHSDWLSMMYERLVVARDLLKDDGVIFISIDDNEVHNLRKIGDEVFGEENYKGQIIRATGTTTGQDAMKIGSSYDSCLCYSKSCLYKLKGIPLKGKDLNRFNNDDNDGRGKYALLQLRKTGNADRKEDRESMFFPISAPDGSLVYPIGPSDYLSRWRVGKDTLKKFIEDKLIVWKENSEIDEMDEEYDDIENDDGEDSRSNIVNEKIDINKYKSKWKPYVKYYLSDRTKQVSNLWVDVDGNKKGSIELKTLFEKKKIFNNPKPLDFIKRLMGISSCDNDIILDFFSGSSTTAHAVMQLNAEDGGDRKFIMVQLPEKTDENSEAFKAGFTTIAEIGKERIRRAGKKINEQMVNGELSMINEGEKNSKSTIHNSSLTINNSQLDIGFRVYKTDTSNMKDVFYHPAALDQQQLAFLESNIKEDRTPEDLLTQVLLDLGLELSLPIETKKIGTNTVFIVQTNALVACFDNDIDFKIVDEIAGLKPFKVVFKDASFKDDKDRINVTERFKRLSPETKVTVI